MSTTPTPLTPAHSSPGGPPVHGTDALVATDVVKTCADSKVSSGVVIADETTGALDQGTSGDVMRHLTAVTRQSGSSLVVVTLDVQAASGAGGWCG